MMKRSSHIAVRVSPDKVQEAVAFYKETLGVVDKSAQNGSVELSGPNFTLWVDASEGEPMALQEFVTNDAASTRARLESAGCKCFDEGPDGFHVRDPYGLSYHVWVEKEASVMV